MALVIVEGPDGAGKTTLIEKLMKRHPDAELHHHGAYLGEKRIAHHYLRSAFRGYKHTDELTIMDRSWLAEPIYGAVMRGGENRVQPWERRMLERVALGAGAVVVLCLPPFETCEAAWSSRLEREYPRKAEQLRAIYAGYSCLPAGAFPNAMLYDYTLHAGTAMLEAIDEAILANRRNEPTIGAHSATSPILLIGDQPGPTEPRIDLPFVSLAVSNGRSGCSVWLTDALERWGVPERELAWVNQIGKHPFEFEDLARYRKIVSLGGAAASWCEQHGVLAHQTYHPQYWKRFRHHETYPLQELLK